MSKAASALGIAPSSVTQHIRNLEDFLGADLFERRANAIALNARGREYAERIRSAFDTIQTATGAVASEIDVEPVRLSCAPTLAGPWLAGQLASIESAFPTVAIRCDFSPTPVDFESDEVDLAIRYGPGDYPGARAELLHVDALAPVCAPDTARGVRSASDLLGARRLDTAESAPDGRSLWSYWAAQAIGDDLAARLNEPSRWTLQGSSFAIEALYATPSIAVLEHSVVKTEIADGRLVAPLGGWVRAPFGYYLVTSKRRALRPAAKRLKALLKRTATAHFGPTP